MFVFVIEYVCMVTVGVEFGEWDMKVPTFQLVIQHIYIMYNGLVMDYCVHFKLVQHLYIIYQLYRSCILKWVQTKLKHSLLI